MSAVLLSALLGATAAEAVAAPDAPVTTPLVASLDHITVTAPTSVALGTLSFITVAGDPSLSTTARLEWSYDQNAWHATSVTVPIEDGRGAGWWRPTDSKYYRLVGDNVASDTWRTTVAKASGYAISAGSRTAQVHALEATYISGAVSRNGVSGAYKVRVDQRLPSGGWVRVTTITTTSSGAWTVRTRATGNMYYRAIVLSSSGSTLATSAEVFVEVTPGTSTIAERRSLMAWRLGKAITSERAISTTHVAAAQYTGGATSAKYQKFEHGVLVEVTSKSGAVNTWLVEGRQLSAYNARSAWSGALGLPERDVRCGLLEDGCVTLFSGGAVYTNGSSMSKGIYVAYGRYAQVETVAAALSQRGYEEPSWRVSKYNKWIGGDNAWCQVFVAWSTYASGHRGEAPVKDYFPNYLAAVKSSPALIRDPKGSQLRPGDILLFDWGTGTPTHTGFVVKVSGSYVYTIEGNTTDGSGDPQRGVYSRKRPLSGVWGAFHPNEY